MRQIFCSSMTLPKSSVERLAPRMRFRWALPVMGLILQTM